jgi:hypothetical protein
VVLLCLGARHLLCEIKTNETDLGTARALYDDATRNHERCTVKRNRQRGSGHEQLNLHKPEASAAPASTHSAEAHDACNTTAKSAPKYSLPRDEQLRTENIERTNTDEGGHENRQNPRVGLDPIFFGKMTL